jgi:hypothetical protein
MKKDILLILFVFISVYIVIFNIKHNKLTDIENPAFLGTTSDYIARNEKGKLIHSINLTQSCFDSIKSSIDTSKPIILILGNSQSQSINQLKPGDKNLIEYVSNGTKKVNIIAHTMPNVNFTEMYLLLRFWSSNFKISQVIIPAFLDDTRMSGMRKDFIEKLINDRFKLEVILDEDKLINKKLSDLKPKDEINKYNLQSYTESFFNKYLNSNSQLWLERSKLESFIAVSLYNLRNEIFNIKASDKRKILTGVYNQNLSFLKASVKYCSNNSIDALIYIPPIRNDVSIPYEIEEYEKFKFECTHLIRKENFKNFEKIIPSNFWGKKMSTNLSGDMELDYMHFQNEGHKILADSLLNFIKNDF